MGIVWNIKKIIKKKNNDMAIFFFEKILFIC